MRASRLAAAMLAVSLAASCASTGEPTNSPALRIVAYPVNRVMDFLDMFSIALGYGCMAGMEAHCTRAAQVGCVAGMVIEGGWWQRRELGGALAFKGDVMFGPWSVIFHVHERASTQGHRSMEFQSCGLNRPSDPIYQELRDYWAIGGSFYLIGGGEFDVHPVEVADFVCGLVFVDFMWDDIGHRR